MAICTGYLRDEGKKFSFSLILAIDEGLTFGRWDGDSLLFHGD